MSEATEKHRKQRQGEVVSAAADKTIVVKVKRRVRHPLYKKVVTRFKKFTPTTRTTRPRLEIRCAFRNARRNPSSSVGNYSK